MSIGDSKTNLRRQPGANQASADAKTRPRPGAQQVAKPVGRASAAAGATPAAAANRPATAHPRPQNEQPRGSAARGSAAGEQEEEEEGDSEGGQQSLARLIKATPSWLVSAVVHIVALLVLGLIMMPPPRDMLKSIISAQTVQEEKIEEVEEVEIVTPPAELEQLSIADVNPDDIGMANFGDITNAVEQAAVGDILVDTMSQEIEVGALFGADGAGMSNVGPGAGGASFFGVQSSGNRFVFIVDGSKSMGAGTKWEDCKKELIDAIGKLGENQYFFVYLFARDSTRLFGPGPNEARQMVRATYENKERLRQWLYEYELIGGTVPYVGMKETMEVLKPDAVYILSDGQFTDKGRVAEDSETYMHNFAKTRTKFLDEVTGIKYQVVVHTIAFQSRSGEAVLNAIAQAYGGTFRYVPSK